MEELCIAVGKTETKFHTFHTCNLFFSTLLSGPNLIISWAKSAVGLTRTNVWTLFSAVSILTSGGKKGKISNVALPKIKCNIIHYKKASYRVVEFKNKVLTNVQLQFLSFIKNNCRQTLAGKLFPALFCSENRACQKRRLSLITIFSCVSGTLVFDNTRFLPLGFAKQYNCRNRRWIFFCLVFSLCEGFCNTSPSAACCFVTSVHPELWFKLQRLRVRRVRGETKPKGAQQHCKRVCSQLVCQHFQPSEQQLPCLQSVLSTYFSYLCNPFFTLIRKNIFKLLMNTWS